MFGLCFGDPNEMTDMDRHQPIVIVRVAMDKHGLVKKKPGPAGLTRTQLSSIVQNYDTMQFS